MTPEERALIDRRHAALARARSILGPVALGSPVLIAVVLFLALRELLEPQLLGWVVLAATMLEAMAMITVWRLVGRQAEAVHHDLQMGLVEEHVITGLRGSAGLSRAGGRLDGISLKRACANFMESTEHAGKTGLASASAALQMLSDPTPMRVTVLPRSRIVLRVEVAE